MTDYLPSWQFIDQQASFSLDNPDCYSYLYFPLMNEAGMMSCVTPRLGGDVKTGQDTFFLEPVSAEELHTSRSTRNFWIYKKGCGIWSATGESARQISQRGQGTEKSQMKAGLLWHSVERENKAIGLRSSITTFVPCEDDTVELEKVTITNVSKEHADITATGAIPIYGRSTDNVRDHRHVTSLLQRICAKKYGVEVRPTLLFNERGHSVCETTYAVLGSEETGKPPVGFFLDVEPFVGDGGTLDWPEAVVENQDVTSVAGDMVAGYEAMGALRFRPVQLAPGASVSYVLALCINPKHIVSKYLSCRKFDFYLDASKKYWKEKLVVEFHTGDETFDQWMRWVTFEPIVRRTFGCSFLPFHDYGRGGRGWRDLWQDCLALTVMGEDVGEMLWNNCAGIRFDGTNATVIGTDARSFLADRNGITRVWMDHGAWPLNTIAFYITQNGRINFLLRKQVYFKDQFCFRCRESDQFWKEEQGTALCCENGEIYQGTVLEHLLIENLTACLNAGDHGMLRLENGDWNDALDMAADRGESVAFSSMYCGNLKVLAELLVQLQEQLGIRQLTLAEETRLLLKPGIEKPECKRRQLDLFCGSCKRTISGRTINVLVDDIVNFLQTEAETLSRRISTKEQVTSSEGFTWLNGYYDNDGEQVEGEQNEVRMTLIGQVFAIMFGIADDCLTREIIRSADRYLYDETVGGYRLNTDFHELKTNLGRQFGFAFGHKENGAVFSHMVVMYANALYKRGFVREGARALGTLCAHCMTFKKSMIYPGIPEYINSRGRGMYHYLTGSASWMVLTYVTQIFGLRGEYGNFVIEPKLLREQFDESGIAACSMVFLGRNLHVTFYNPLRLDYGSYSIANLKIDGKCGSCTRKGGIVKLKGEEILNLDQAILHRIDVTLNPKPDTRKNVSDEQA